MDGDNLVLVVGSYADAGAATDDFKALKAGQDAGEGGRQRRPSRPLSHTPSFDSGEDSAGDSRFDVSAPQRRDKWQRRPLQGTQSRSRLCHI